MITKSEKFGIFFVLILVSSGIASVPAGFVYLLSTPLVAALTFIVLTIASAVAIVILFKKGRL